MSGRGLQGSVTSIGPMPGKLRNTLLGAVAATAIAGCGSDDGTIPEGNAENLLNRVDAIDSHVDQGDCGEAAAQAEGFREDVDALPAEVDDEVKEGLRESASQLATLTSSDCEETDENTTDIGGVVPTDTTEEPETTETETTETTEPETTTEQTTEEPTTEEPQEDPDLAPGNSQGQGGGVGSDGGIGPGRSGEG